jgi:hypothetical protein
LGFFEDLDFPVELVSLVDSALSSFTVRVLRKLLEGVPASENSNELELTSSLIRFDGFGLGDRDVDGGSALAASYKVTAPWYGLAHAESLVTALDTCRVVEGIARK